MAQIDALFYPKQRKNINKLAQKLMHGRSHLVIDAHAYWKTPGYWQYQAI
jgi:adenylate kinase